LYFMAKTSSFFSELWPPFPELPVHSFHPQSYARMMCWTVVSLCQNSSSVAPFCTAFRFLRDNQVLVTVCANLVVSLGMILVWSPVISRFQCSAYPLVPSSGHSFLSSVSLLQKRLCWRAKI
jgi:hypothetical protein